MSRLSFKWILAALAVAALAPICFAFGWRLIPARAATAAVGKVVPWAIAWGLVWTAAAVALVLAGAMATTGSGDGKSS